MRKYNRLEDSYDDIKGAALDTLERNKNRYELPINQAMAYFMNEMEGVFEENEFERIITLIPVGKFMIENKNYDSKLINDIKKSISKIESNEYDSLLNSEDKNKILEDIKYIKKYI